MEASLHRFYWFIFYNLLDCYCFKDEYYTKQSDQSYPGSDQYYETHFLHESHIQKKYIFILLMRKLWKKSEYFK
jgi:hypothetical protein